MTVDEMKELKIGGRVKYATFQGIWTIKEIVERGIVLVHYDSESAHKHLLEWTSSEEIVNAQK